MKTIGQVLRLSVDFLRSKNSSQGRLELEYLIASFLSMKRLELYLHFDKPLDDSELSHIRQGVVRLAQGEPLAYIEGTASFYGMEFLVDKRVLIPRPETELLVDAAIKQARQNPEATLWDVCTGSGCVGLAIKKAVGTLDVSLSDISPDALDVAKMNAQRHSLEVNFVQGSLLEPFQGKMADIITCNPPYINDADYTALEPHVKDFEPEGALRAGKSGLEHYLALSRTVRSHLKPGALLLLELGAGISQQVQELFEAQGFSSFDRLCDYAGHDRVLLIRA